MKIKLLIKHSCLAVIVALSMTCATTVYAFDFLPLSAPSVILVEQSTGKTLYAKNEHDRMYPASMTKILTALVALEYLDPDDVVVVGEEIYGLPGDSMRSGHQVGESITVMTLLRLLMIRSGNETGCVLAINAVRAATGRQGIAYAEAERIFCGMMNDRAAALGALDSNFSNPHGYHSDDHYTTAYDLALISRAYMENALLRQIAGETAYIGDSLGDRVIDGAKTLQYNWPGHNALIMDGANAYPYATGIKTGFTDQASDCVTASATRNDVSLIAVIFASPDPGRWQDARLLFDYGFEMYAFETIQQKDVTLDTVSIANNRLGEPDTLALLTNDTAIDFLKHDDMAQITREIIFDTAYIAEETGEDGAVQLQAPIEKDALLGTVRYILNGETLFEGEFRAAEAVLARNTESDVDYYLAAFKDNIFTVRALPYWFGVGGLLVGFLGIIVALRSRRHHRERRYASSYSGRYSRKGRY